MDNYKEEYDKCFDCKYAREKQIEEASVRYQLEKRPMAIGGDAFADMVYRYNINPSFVAGAKWADENQWRDVEEQLPNEDEEEPFLCLYWEEDQEQLYDDDDTKYDENGLCLGIAYYYGNNNWKATTNGAYATVYVRYWIPIPYRPEQKKKSQNI